MRAHFRRVVALKSVAAGSATWQSNSSRQHAQHAQHNANLTSSLAHIWFRRRRGNTCVALAKGVAGRGGGAAWQEARGEGEKGVNRLSAMQNVAICWKMSQGRHAGSEVGGRRELAIWPTFEQGVCATEYMSTHMSAHIIHICASGVQLNTHSSHCFAGEFNKLRLRQAAAHKIPNGPQLLQRFSGNLSPLTQRRPTLLFLYAHHPPSPSTIFAPACLLSAVVLLVVGVWSPNAFAACTTNKFRSAHNMSNPIKGRNINHHTPSPLPLYA